MTTKIAVSLPDHLVADARAAVQQGRADSLSAYVANAMRQHAQTETLAALLDDLDTLHGPPGLDDFAWADRVLGLV